MSEEIIADTSAKKNISKDVVEAIMLLAQGKRNLLCGEITQAANQLQEASRIFGAHYGETADECADAYFCYGRSLLELSRLETGVLGDAVQGDDSEASQSSVDSESDDEQNSTAEDEGEPGEEANSVVSEDLEDEEAEHAKQEAEHVKQEAELVIREAEQAIQDGGVATATTAMAAECSSTTANGGASNAEDAEEVSSLQLAWEMFELAKIIFKRHDRDEMQLKLAETCLKLGEIGMETEQYEQAISDLTECLKIQSAILPPEDRRIAETLYQLGLACTFDRAYDAAIANYQRAATVIKAKISALRRVVSGEVKSDKPEDYASFDSPIELAQKEVLELDEILPDILAKIEDVEDEQRNADKVKQLLQQNLPEASGCNSGVVDSNTCGESSSGFQSTLADDKSKPVHNITHLVRRKRKTEDEDVEETTKKLKHDVVADTGSGDRLFPKDLPDGSTVQIGFGAEPVTGTMLIGESLRAPRNGDGDLPTNIRECNT